MEFSAENLLGRRGVLWAVGALAVILFLVTNLPWQLDDYDQAKQAFASFEMVNEGHWLYQHTPHERVATKPPLVAWISAGLFALTRSWDVAWRLPSVAAAIATSILLFRTGTAFGLAGGLVAAGAFAFNLLTPRLATLVRTDMPLALAIFLIGFLIWEKVRKREAWSSRDRSWIFVLLTAAMLIKGPIVYAFLLPGIAMFEWRRRKSENVRAWCGWWPWLASLGVFLVWVIAGSIFVPGFFDQVVVREFVARFGETVHRPQPLLFYLPHLLQKFFPWSVLMIVLAFVDLRARRWNVRAAFREMSPETFWLVSWILGGLIVMSIVPSKRVDRIFPVIPPLCLLLGPQVGGISSNEEWRERVYRWSAAALLLAILFTSGYAVSKVISGYRGHRDALMTFGHEVRRETQSHHWRYEAIAGSHEGMLLYLERAHFIQPDRAVAEWNRGNLDALVVPIEEAPELMRLLHDAALSRLQSGERKDERGMGYVLISR